MEKIDPRVDLAFKKIFGSEENKDLLISLINSVVSKEDQVSEVTLLNPYNQKNFKNDKLSILDIKAEGSTGKKFNIEIQISDEADYDKRALYYWAKLYTGQLETAKDYGTLNKVIGIHILNFTSIPKVEKYHNVFHITEKETGLKYFYDLELHTIELKKFTDYLDDQFGDIGSKIQNSLDMWSAFLTRNEVISKAKLPKKIDNSGLKKAIKVLGVMNLSKEEREAYEDHLKWLRIESNTLKKAEQKGHELGLKKGKTEGLKEGELKGEKMKARAISKKMLNRGRPLKEIIEDTGLTKKEILSLSSKKQS